MADSMREALSKAFDADAEKTKNEDVAKIEGGGAPENSEKPVGAAPEVPGADAGKELPTLAGKEPAEGDDKTKLAAAKSDGDRGAEKPAAGAKPDKAVPSKEGESAAPVAKAPQSWSPKAREHWAKIPAEAQAEIAKRETEIQRGLSASASARKFGDEFHKTVAPFETLMRAQGAASPLDAIKPLLNTAAGLSLGSVQQKANIVANIIKTYGVDISTLDQILTGQAPKEGAKGGDGGADLRAMIQAELGPVREFMGQVHGARTQTEQQTTAAADSILQAFKEKPDVAEFIDDVGEDMADLLDTAARRGRKISLQQAFDQACQLNPEIMDIINKRKQKSKDASDTKNLERSKNASSSLPAGGPNGMGSGAPKDLRSAVAMAYDKHA